MTHAGRNGRTGSVLGVSPCFKDIIYGNRPSADKGIAGRNLWRSFTGKFTAWESDANEIKRQKTRWTSMKKDLEDKLSADKHNVEVQKWIKKDGDPEPQIGTIKRRVMPDGNYEDAAKWFLDTSQFRAWCDNFREPESPPAAKRVLWVRGTYGTGKTTLLYHTYTALKEEPEFNLGNRSVRIVPYFCDANKAGTTRPDYNTVIRALIRHLSLLPDFTLSKLALDKYSRDPNPRSQGDDVDIGEWEDLFKELVVEGADEYHFVFVVDALDECLNLKEAEHFLYFMSKKVMPLCPNVHLLCSSRQQVRVNDHFSEERRHDVEVTSAVTALEMKKFITGELARRRSISKDSVFCKYRTAVRFLDKEYANPVAFKDTPQNTDLLGNLQKLLLDHARGMFRWVQIWLDILLPVLDDQKTIRKRETATEWLENLRSDVTHKHGAEQQLESGYQRLWGFNDILGFEDQRIRLFQIVLAAFEPQAPENLREALRIQGSTYNQDLTTEQVKRLYSNFLYEDRRSDHWKTGKELRFVHESARKFILNMKYLDGSEKDDEAQFSERKNHLAVANLYIDVVGLLTHPFWQANGLEPSNWTEILTTSPKATRLKQDLRTWSHHDTAFYVYLVKYGLRHCDLAARKRSMFDDIWSKVLDRVILAPVSAFGFTMLVDESIVFSDPKFIDQDWLYVLGESEGHIKLFPSHALAGLNIIHEDDLSRLQLPTGEPCGVFESQARQRRLFEHAACVGNNFPPNDFRSHSGTENALQIACNTKNRAAVDMILQATESLSSNSVNSIILATQDRHYNSPIAIAIRKHSFAAGRDPSYFHIIETLLKFGRCNSSMRGVSSRLHLAAGPYISKQWSLESSNNASSGPALHLVAELFEEHQISHLLSIARPEDINTRDRWGCSILHIAAMRGFLGLTRELVEEYDADIEAKTIDGWTPSYLALGTKEEELVKYFKSRGANFDFEAVKED